VPDIAGRLELTRDLAFRTWRMKPYAAANLLGASRLSFDEGLDRRTDGYVVVRAGIAAERDGLIARIDIDNLFDARSDTFAFGNPFSVRSVQQYTPMRPRSVSVSIARRF
jgi:outer membrane receptor protein involved in Fe transport